MDIAEDVNGLEATEVNKGRIAERAGSTMAERVALIFAQHGDHFFDNDGPSSASWDDFSPREQLVATAAARAAIEAMMEPTEAQIKVGHKTIGQFTNWDYGGVEIEPNAAREVWVDMLSAALRSSLKGEGE